MSSGPVRQRVGLTVALSTGAVLLGANAFHLVAADENLQSLVFGVVIPLLLSILVLVGSLWLWLVEGTVDFLRVGTWCVLGAVAIGAGSALIIPYQHGHGVSVADPIFVVLGAASFGAPIGFVVGLYDNNRRVALREAAAEHERAVRLNRRLTVVNRVLRHDIRNSASVIGMRAELLADDLDEPNEHIAEIRKQTEEFVTISERARDLERLLGDDTDVDTVDVASVLDGCVDWVRAEYPSVELDVSTPAEARIPAHPLVDSAIRTLVQYLLDQGDRANRRLEITLDEVDNCVDVRITDTGPGVPAEARDILDRGRETQLEHTDGFDLWLVSWVMDESGGEIQFDSGESGQSVISLWFEGSVSHTETTDDEPAVPSHVGPIGLRPSAHSPAAGDQ